MTGGRANGMRLFENVWGRVAVITKVLTSSEHSYQMDAAIRPGSKRETNGVVVTSVMHIDSHYARCQLLLEATATGALRPYRLKNSIGLNRGFHFLDTARARA